MAEKKNQTADAPDTLPRDATQDPSRDATHDASSAGWKAQAVADTVARQKKGGGATRSAAEAKREVLRALAVSGNITAACVAAGVRRRQYYRWRDADPAFAQAAEDAIEAYADTLESEVDRRAVEGVLEPVGFYQGVHGGTWVRKYSDSLLMFRLKKLRPEYREQSTVAVSMRALVSSIDLTRLSAEQVARIAAGEHPAAVIGADRLAALAGAAAAASLPAARDQDPDQEPDD